MDEPREEPPSRAPRVPGAFTTEQAEAVRARAWVVGYRTPEALARAVGVSRPSVVRWLSGERAPAAADLVSLASALGWPWPTDFLLPPDAPAGDASAGDARNGGILASPGGGRYGAWSTGATGRGRRDVPVYRAGTRTDPVAPNARASSEDEVALLEADARVLGERGFGIRVVDESLSNWTVARGDVLWFDPDWPVELVETAGDAGLLVAVLLPCGELQARVLRGGELVTDGADTGEAVPFTPKRYRGRNVGRMKPIDKPRRIGEAAPTPPRV